MKAFDEEFVLMLHDEMLAETGGSDGIRDKGLLESAINAPFQTFGGEDLYPTLFEKAARLGYGIIKNHPFVDCNKRTGTHVMHAFLRMNGFKLKCSHNDLIEVIYKVADGGFDYNDLLKWLKEHVSSTEV